MRLTHLLSLLAALFVLGLILMPVTGCGCSREASKASACFSQVKHQGLGLFMYADDADGRYPNRDVWMDSILPYVKNPQVYHVPEYAKSSPWFYGYAFNAALSLQKAPIVEAVAEKTPLVYDSSNPIRNASDRVTSLPVPGRHGGRNHMAYADGHVKTLKAGKP